METKIDLNSVYVASQDIVAREIEGELIIVPIVAGIGDIEDGIFTLDENGKTIWESLDGKKTLKVIASDLSKCYRAPAEEIERDIRGLVKELVKRKILVKST